MECSPCKCVCVYPKEPKRKGLTLPEVETNKPKLVDEEVNKQNGERVRLLQKRIK